MSRRVLVLVGIAVVVFTVTFAVVRRQTGDEPGVRGLAARDDDPFASGDTVAGVVDGVLSPDGRLAVLTEDGLGIVERNRVVGITEPGARVVDFAWFPNRATLLVAEGPTPTGLLAVVDVDGGGKVRGSIRLQPSIGFGEGFGMSVAPAGKRAIVTAVDRAPLGGDRRHLVTVNLETGATSDLTPAGGPDELEPVHLSDDRAAFVERDGDHVRTRIIDLATGAVEDGPDGMVVVSASDGRPVVVDPEDGRVLAGDVELGTVPAGATVVGIDVAGGWAVLVESTATGTRLRRVPL